MTPVGTRDRTREDTCPQGVTRDSGLGRKPHSELRGEGLARLETQERGSPRWVWAGMGLRRRTSSTQGRAVGRWPAVGQVRRDRTWGPCRRRGWRRSRGQARGQRAPVRRSSRASSFRRGLSARGPRSASSITWEHRERRLPGQPREPGGGGRLGTGSSTGASGGTGDRGWTRADHPMSCPGFPPWLTCGREPGAAASCPPRLRVPAGVVGLRPPTPPHSPGEPESHSALGRCREVSFPIKHAFLDSGLF